MKYFKKYFITWYVPILSYFIPYLIFQLGMILKKDEIIDLSLAIFYLNIIGNFISAVVQIVIKKWYFLVPQIMVSAFLFFSVAMYLAFSPPDFYGANKVIPKNIKFEIPAEKELTEKDLKQNDFKLAELSQPGIYNFYTNHQPNESGYFYIKAFEITSNDRLSENRITERSKIVVEKPCTKIYSGDFTIYEGSWDDQYGARIELWYHPNSSSEYKIIQKNYIIEGWMR
ncbi:hypothetical protein OMO38_17800 [Chryseobacterium sp. 09-1422]|uniref:SMODS-associating 2TM beta-strand rich effector domain-containing protein n=1 Tax=Chryseobacterium kimseyorum TaxID=2984028 RepID=A0ABT3I2T3_9FLAO|nr:hypothetical protein [Chryseobacterium kimseyorum]MCW3170385.1 hypothetical protein [Chryseobacterium kimseyorum]